MTFTRSRVIGTAIVLLVSLVAVAPPASAASTNLLGTSGNFEKPALAGPGKSKTITPGHSFAGWKVKTASVALSTAFSPYMIPPQGKQALALVKVKGDGGPPAGTVCRPIPTIAGHRYAISFQGTDVNSGQPQIVVELGANQTSVQLAPGGPEPAVFQPFKVKLTAAIADAVLCFTATNLTALSFPVIDAAKVVDLSP